MQHILSACSPMADCSTANQGKFLVKFYMSVLVIGMSAHSGMFFVNSIENAIIAPDGK